MDGAEAINNMYPTDYRAELFGFLRADPTLGDVKDALVSEPALKPIGSVSRYVVCVRFKSAAGGAPADAKERIAIFFSGRVNQFIEATRDQCAAVSYNPLGQP